MPRCQSVSLFAAVTNAGLGVFDEYFAIATDTFGSVMIPELALVWRHCPTPVEPLSLFTP